MAASTRNARSPLPSRPPARRPIGKARATASCCSSTARRAIEVHHYPRGLCPHCFCDKLDWKQASGNGKIYTYSVMRRAPEPYVIAYVTLDEGVSMMTNIVDCDFDKVRIDQPVKVVFKASENGQPVPVFSPA